VPEVCFVHVVPSAEVVMLPPPPTAANCDPDQAEPRSPKEGPPSAVLTGVYHECGVQVFPEGEVRTHCPQELDAPIAKNCVPDQITPFRYSAVPEVCDVQATPVGEVRMVPLAPTLAN
jgi:hypothetical protein